MYAFRIAAGGRVARGMVAVILLMPPLFAALYRASSTPPAAARSACASSFQSPPAKELSKLRRRETAFPTEIIVIAPDETQEQRVADLLEQADLLVKAGRYTPALEKVTQAGKIDRANADVIVMTIRIRNILQNENDLERLVNEADAYFKDSQFAPAAGLYQAYVARRPEQVPELRDRMLTCSFNLGVLAMRRGACAEAYDYFRQSLFLDPRHSPSSTALELARRCVDAVKPLPYMDATLQILPPSAVQHDP